MRLSVLIPVLGRPHRVVPVLDSLGASLLDSDVDWVAVFLASQHDDEEHAAVETARLAGYDSTILRVLTGDPNYAAKINAGAAASQADWLFFGADDLRFHKGWWEKAMQHALLNIGVIGTNDLCNRRTMRGEHSTHHLVAKWYASQPTIDNARGPLFEGYVHEFCDDEFVGTAKKRGNWAHATDSFVEHLHPMCGKCPESEAEADPHYHGMVPRLRFSRRLFNERSALWA